MVNIQTTDLIVLMRNVGSFKGITRFTVMRESLKAINKVIKRNKPVMCISSDLI